MSGFGFLSQSQRGAHTLPSRVTLFPFQSPSFSYELQKVAERGRPPENPPMISSCEGEGWLEGPYVRSRDAVLTKQGKSPLCNPSCRFGAPQGENLRAADDLKQTWAVQVAISFSLPRGKEDGYPDV